MRPKERRESGQKDLFKARLDQIVDLDHALGCGLIKPEPETDASDFDHCEIVESAAVVTGRDTGELLGLLKQRSSMRLRFLYFTLL